MKIRAPQIFAKLFSAPRVPETKSKINIMKTIYTRNLSLLAGLLLLAGAASLQAASGIWINTASGGLWGTGANWSGGTIADGGSGVTADFSTLDITADNTVHLDGNRSVNTLLFGDTAPSTAASWTLDNNSTPANTLTLAGTTPTINVGTLGSGKSATISAVIAGTAGLTKAGAGTLVLNGAAVNTYTGGTVVTNGTLLESFVNISPTTTANLINSGNALTLGGATFQLNGNGSSASSQTFASLTLPAGGGHGTD